MQIALIAMLAIDVVLSLLAWTYFIYIEGTPAGERYSKVYTFVLQACIAVEVAFIVFYVMQRTIIL